jgi:hypothetical protein
VAYFFTHRFLALLCGFLKLSKAGNQTQKGTEADF